MAYLAMVSRLLPTPLAILIQSTSAAGKSALMDAVLAIPRLLVDLGVYLLLVMPDLLPIILALATPLALGALCGVINERSGVVNIGIEGIMLTAAFTGYLTGFALHETLGSGPALGLGVAVAILTGAVLGLLHAWLCVSVRADQIIAGTIINIAAFGLTGYLNRLIVTPSGLGGAGVIPTLSLPDSVTSIPLVGPLIAMFFEQGPIAMSVIFLVIGLQILLFRSRWGLRTRAVGEHPRAADTVGIDVFRLRYRNVIAGCALAGLAGAYLTLESTGSFQNGMTGGRGFIALAALIFGAWRPFGAFGAALLFGFSSALARRLPEYSAQGATLFEALPYVLTLIAVAGVIGRSIPPAAIGRPYEKQ
jgi:simple sugar transport system permease protein